MITRLPTTARSFDAIAAAIRGFRWRPEVEVTEIGSPQRLAPYALALEAEVRPGGGDNTVAASGRLVVLHNPAGDDTWQGDTRFVSYTQADVDFEMAADPLLADVGWSWLTDALRHAGARCTAVGGTVTTMTSRSFGELDDTPERAEIELRCSWTALDAAPAFSPWTDDDWADDDPTAATGRSASHVAAWQELLCQVAGLEPLAEGITSLGRRSRGNR